MTSWDLYADWRQSVGYRFVQWTCTMSDLTSAQKARDYEKFAV